MSVEALEAALRDMRLPVTVAEQGRLAVLSLSAVATLDARTRRAIVATARAHGFSNVCLELEADAPLPGD